MLGIRTVAKHFGVVVGFDHERVSPAHIEVGALCDIAGVGSDDETEVAGLDCKANVVCAVVTDFKGRNGHACDLKGEFLIYGAMIVFDASGDAVASQQAVESLRGAEEAHVAVAAKDGVGIFDVVAVVVSEDDAFDLADVDAVVEEFVCDKVVVDTGVNEDTAAVSADVGAVAAASAAERDEAHGQLGSDVSISDIGNFGFNDFCACAFFDYCAGNVVARDVDIIK